MRVESETDVCRSHRALRELSSPWCVLLALMLVASLVNVLEFPQIESRTRRGYQALASHPNPDLVGLGRKTQSNVARRYGFAFALAAAAPNSRIYLPRSGDHPDAEIRAQLASYGRAELVLLNYDPLTWAGELDLKKNRVAARTKAVKFGRKFLILAKADPKRRPTEGVRKTRAREFVYLVRQNADVLVDVSLVASDFERLRR
jgi:hypothetical protein